MEKTKLEQAVKRAARSLWRSFPILIGIILLVSLANTLIPKSYYAVLFSKIPIFDSLIGSLAGSILAGNPITSYIIGGELLEQGIGLIAVTAFIVAWVSVGIIQLPAESFLLGKKFAITRNIVAFLSAIVVALITTGVINLL